jgi:MFS family permease
MTAQDTPVNAHAGLDDVALEKDHRLLFAVILVIAQFALLTALLTPVVVGIAVKVSIIAPESAAQVQGIALGTGSLMALIASPLFGNLSDRTRSRFGRRRPWLIGGAGTGAVALLIIGLTDSVVVLVIAWALAQLALNASTAAINALYADRIPGKWQGRVGALLGVATNFAAIAGAATATAFSGNLVLTFVVPAIVAIVAVVVLSIIVRDSASDARDIAPFSLLETIKSFGWPVRANRDFSLNFLSRFLIWLGYSALMSYQALLFIQRFAIPPAEVASYMLAATGISGVATLIGSVGSGWLTDRLDRRRDFVIAAGVILGASLIAIGFAPSVVALFAAGAVAGLGLGIYLAVDLALAVRLIPDSRLAGRYMGIVTLANNAPGVITPFIAPFLLAIGATATSPNFTALFLAAGAMSILGALVMLGVRSVK